MHHVSSLLARILSMQEIRGRSIRGISLLCLVQGLSTLPWEFSSSLTQMLKHASDICQDHQEEGYRYYVWYKDEVTIDIEDGQIYYVSGKSFSQSRTLKKRNWGSV